MDPNTQNPVPTPMPGPIPPAGPNPAPQPTTPMAAAPDAPMTNPAASPTMGTPAPTQVPVFSSAPPTMESMAPQPSAKPSSSKTKKLVIGGSIGAGVLILAIVVIVVIVQALRPDYQTAYQKSSEMYDTVSDFVFKSNCQKVRANVMDYRSVGIAAYDEYVEKCKTDANEFYAAVEEFGALSGVAKDSEISELYNKFKVVVATNAPGKDKLEDTLKAYAAYHNYNAKMGELDFYSDELPSTSDVAAAAQYLIDSGNNELKVYGEGLKQRYDAYYQAWQQYKNARDAYLNSSYRDGSYQSAYDAYEGAYDAYSAARDSYGDYSSFNNRPDISDLDLPLAEYNDTGNGSITDTFDNVIRALGKKV